MNEPDPVREFLKRIQTAHSEYKATSLLLGIQRNELRKVIREARKVGITLAMIGDLIGVSRQHVAQLSK